MACLQTAHAIVKDLIENNICKYCILRFLNEKNQESYNSIDSDTIKILGQECDIVLKSNKQSPCSACLGLLQVPLEDDFIQQVINKVKNCDYDSEDVTFALSLPIAFILRNYSLWLYLSDKYFSFYLDRSSTYSHILGDIKQDGNVVSVKEAWKWKYATAIANKLGKKVNDGVNGNFHVNINVEYVNDAQETACLVVMHPCIFKVRAFQKRKYHGEILTRKSVECVLTETDLETLQKHCPVPPQLPSDHVTCSSVDCIHDSIYLAGRYKKWSRTLSQTPWLIKGERHMEHSVEEHIIKPVQSLVVNDGIKFSSSGREDVDVRTLGKGRPFFLDITNPRKTKLSNTDLRRVENAINNSTKDIFVRDLQLVRKEELCQIKLGEQTKTKTYTALCVIKLTPGEDTTALRERVKSLDTMKDIQLQQKTPIRVLHRRPLAVRPRLVLWVQTQFCDKETDNTKFVFKLKLQVEAGTYIKEFVHGDFSRTKPNVSQLLERETDILALDVEEVNLNWPPCIDYE